MNKLESQPERVHQRDTTTEVGTLGFSFVEDGCSVEERIKKTPQQMLKKQHFSDSSSLDLPTFSYSGKPPRHSPRQRGVDATLAITTLAPRAYDDTRRRQSQRELRSATITSSDSYGSQLAPSYGYPGESSSRSSLSRRDEDALRSLKKAKKKKKKKKKKSSKHSSGRSRSTCSSNVSWSEFHVDGVIPSPSERLTTSAELAVHQRSSHKRERHIRTFATPPDNGDSTTVDTDETPRVKPAELSRLEQSSELHRRSRHDSCDYDSDTTTLSSLDRDGRPPNNYHRTQSTHPPTDLEFALEMDSSARKLKRIAKDQEDAVVRKQVDYGQLRELLDVYAKDPRKADQDRLNQLLGEMSDAMADVRNESCSKTMASSFSSASPSSRSQRVAFQSAVDYQASREPSPSLSSSEKELYSTLDPEKGGYKGVSRMEIHKREILQACGEQQAADFVSVPRKSAMPKRTSRSDSSRSSSSTPSLMKMNSYDESPSRHQRVPSGPKQATSDNNDSPDSSTARPFEGSPASSISSAPPSDDGEGKKDTEEEARSQTRSARMPTHKQEVLRVFGEHAEDFVSVSRNRSSKKKKTAEHHKQEVLQVFGEDVHGDQELVAVPREPPTRQRRIDAVALDPQHSNDGHLLSQDRSVGDNDGEKPLKVCPALLGRVTARWSRRKKRRNSKSKKKSKLHVQARGEVCSDG